MKVEEALGALEGTEITAQDFAKGTQTLQRIWILLFQDGHENRMLHFSAEDRMQSHGCTSRNHPLYNYGNEPQLILTFFL